MRRPSPLESLSRLATLQGHGDGSLPGGLTRLEDRINVGSGPGRVAILCERLCIPDGERRTVGPQGCLTGEPRASTKFRKVLVDVHFEPGLGGQRVAAGAGEVEIGPADGASCPVDGHLQIRGRIRGQPIRPEPFGQHVVWHVAAPAGDQDP